MLLRFAFSNFLSVRDRQELMLTASTLRDQPSRLLAAGAGGMQVVPVAAIYGANASGKTNILLGLRHLINTILYSHSHRDPGGGTAAQPFRLDENSLQSPSRFDIDFMLDGVRYHFGFEETREAVTEEWLHAYPRGRRQEWYHRQAKGPITFGPALAGRNRTIEELMRPNSLFISAAVQNNHEQLSPIFNFLRDNFTFILYDRSSLVDSPRLAGVLSGGDRELENILKFLSHADVGIRELKVEDRDRKEEVSEFLTDFLDFLAKKLPGVPENLLKVSALDLKKIVLGHAKSDGNIVFFDVGQESRGTRELLGLLGPVFDCVGNGKILMVDELDSSLHPLISAKIVELFADSANPQDGQLIFTTHDTNFLGCEALRRDEIWFTEKDREGATHLYPLTDIKTRKTDNLHRGYMQGRFGAIPYLGNFDALSTGSTP